MTGVRCLDCLKFRAGWCPALALVVAAPRRRDCVFFEAKKGVVE